MRALMIGAFALLLPAAAAAQGAVTVPFDAEMEAALEHFRALENAARAAQQPPLPPLSLLVYAQAQAQLVFTQLVEQLAILELQDNNVEQKIRGRSQVDRAAIRSFIDRCIADGSCPVVP